MPIEHPLSKTREINAVMYNLQKKFEWRGYEVLENNFKKH